jgi:hypothetical protein
MNFSHMDMAIGDQVCHLAPAMSGNHVAQEFVQSLTF